MIFLIVSASLKKKIEDKDKDSCNMFLKIKKRFKLTSKKIWMMMLNVKDRPSKTITTEETIKKKCLDFVKVNKKSSMRFIYGNRNWYLQKTTIHICIIFWHLIFITHNYIHFRYQNIKRQSDKLNSKNSIENICYIFGVVLQCHLCSKFVRTYCIKQVCLNFR